MRHFLHLAYEGTKYHGWQRQPKFLSVQQVIEEGLGKMLKRRTTIMGCGRTDTGVHASQYYAHAYLPEEWDFDPVERLNRILPEDIAIKEIYPVGSRLHAQRSATQRTYDYHLHLQKDPFRNNLSTYFPDGPLDIELMQSVVPLLQRYQDYRMFCKQAHLYKTTICEVSTASLTFDESKQSLHFQISANRFLRSMVRLIVHRLIRVGTGDLTPERFEAFLQGTEQPQYFYLAHPQGLYLSGVEY